MASTTFDTLTAVRDLEAAGVDRRQAEAIAGTVRQAINADRDTLATQADLAGLESRIDAKLEALEGRIYRALWIQGIGIVAIIGGFIAIAGALKLL